MFKLKGTDAVTDLKETVPRGGLWMGRSAKDRSSAFKDWRKCIQGRKSAGTESGVMLYLYFLTEKTNI